MTQYICPDCQIPTQNLNDVCPQCGAQVELEVSGKDAAVVGGLIVGAIMVSLLGFFVFFFESFFLGMPLIFLGPILFFFGDHRKNKTGKPVWYRYTDGRKYRLEQD